MEISIGSIPLEKESKEAVEVITEFLKGKGYNVTPFRKPYWAPFGGWLRVIPVDCVIFDVEPEAVNALVHTIEKYNNFGKPILFLYNSQPREILLNSSSVRFSHYNIPDEAKLNVIEFLKLHNL